MTGDSGSAPGSAEAGTCPHSLRESGAPTADPGEEVDPPGRVGDEAPGPTAALGDNGAQLSGAAGTRSAAAAPAPVPSRPAPAPHLPHSLPAAPGLASRHRVRRRSLSAGTCGLPAGRAEGTQRSPNFPRALTGGAHGAPHAPRRPPPRPLRHGPSKGRGEGAHCSPAPPPSRRSRSTPRPSPHNAPRLAAE